MRTPTYRKPFTSSLLKQPQATNVGYRIFITQPALEAIKSAGSYRQTQINLKIQSLSSMPRPKDAGRRISSTDAYRIAIGYWRLEYVVFSGEVTITHAFLDMHNSDSAKQETPCLYKITKLNNSIWAAPQRTKTITTEYAAINGILNDLNTAKTLMSKHITAAFGPEVSEFTLLHNPTRGLIDDIWESGRDKLGATTSIAEYVASILNDCQKNSQSVNWVVHSQGGLIFSQAVLHHNKIIGTPLNNHKVQFHSGANNKTVTHQILKTAGIKKYGPDNNHPFDIVPNVIGLNTSNPIKLFGALATSLALTETKPLTSIPNTHKQPNTRKTWKFWEWNENRR